MDDGSPSLSTLVEDLYRLHQPRRRSEKIEPVSGPKLKQVSLSIRRKNAFNSRADLSKAYSWHRWRDRPQYLLRALRQSQQLCTLSVKYLAATSLQHTVAWSMYTADQVRKTVRRPPYPRIHIPSLITRPWGRTATAAFSRQPPATAEFCHYFSRDIQTVAFVCVLQLRR
jgi:hypothetical protein